MTQMRQMTSRFDLARMKDVSELDDQELELALSTAPPELKAILLVERHKRCCEDETSAFLGDCESIYLLKNTTLPDGRFLWQLFAPDPDWSWNDFCLDILEMEPRRANQRARVWEVYRIRLGLPLEFLTTLGRSKLLAALGSLRRSLEPGNEEEEPDVAGLVDYLASQPSYYELLEHLREHKEQEVAVSFQTSKLVEGNGDIGLIVSACGKAIARLIFTEDCPEQFRQAIKERLNFRQRFQEDVVASFRP